MKVGVVGSRNLTVKNIEWYIPPETSLIITGGAKGIDTCAIEYAEEKELEYLVFKPNYSRYKKGAPQIRNRAIVDYSDLVIAFWDGISTGTKGVIDYCLKQNSDLHIYIYTGGRYKGFDIYYDSGNMSFDEILSASKTLFPEHYKEMIASESYEQLLQHCNGGLLE